MHRPALLAVVAAALVQAFPGRAAADIIQYESLDLAVTSADLVIRGEVVAIDTRKGENGVVWNRLTVKVAETIKVNGAPGTRLPIYSTDFKALTGPKEILAAARAAAAAPAGKAKSRLEWIVQGPDTLLPHAVLFPDSERVRAAAAEKRRIELLQWKM
jgi:hypothetical protein